MAGSGDGQRAVPGSGEDKRVLLHSLDYPCTRRLRLRRLLAYHRRYIYEDVYEALKKRMRLVFSVRELMKHVKTGQWRVAYSYVLNFVHSDSMSHEADTLLLFLEDLMVLNEFAEGNDIVACLLSNWFVSIYKDPVVAEYPCFATLVADVLFLRSDHASAFLNWRLVRNNAAEMVEKMVYKTPELKDKLHLPRGPNNLYHVVPIGSSFHRRRHVKIACRKQSTDYAQFYLQMRRRLPSWNQVATPDCSGSARISGEPLMALLEEALQAGRRPVLEQGHIPEYSSPEYPSSEGFPLVQMQSGPPFLANSMTSEVHWHEHSRKDTSHADSSQSPAAIASSETNSAMKHSSFQESHWDSAHLENDPKRP